jgi:ribosome-associated protein
MLIRITRTLQIDERDLEESFVTGSGPGGQNVNKVASAVLLRFNLAANTTLPEHVKTRLATLAGSRLTKEGVINIQAEQFRDQPRNREDARERLFGLIREAAIIPKIRRPTKPTKGSQTRRLDAKSRRSDVKRQRQDKGF